MAFKDHDGVDERIVQPFLQATEDQNSLTGLLRALVNLLGQILCASPAASCRIRGEKNFFANIAEARSMLRSLLGLLRKFFAV